MKTNLEAKLTSLLETRRSLADLDSGNLPGVARRRRLSNDEFLSCYYAANRPVAFFDLFTGSFAAKQWNLDLLKARYGRETVQVMADRERDPFYERDYDAHRKSMPFGDYIDLLKSKPESNDHYLVANNHLLDSPAFHSLFDDFEWPSFLDPARRGKRVFLWIGPAGTITPLHHDDCNILLAQMFGRKRVSLIAPEFTPYVYNNVTCFSDVDFERPDFNEFPNFRRARSLEITLHPGEALFIPVLWWHHVKSLDTSISLSFSNFIFPNEFRIAWPEQRT